MKIELHLLGQMLSDVTFALCAKRLVKLTPGGAEGGVGGCYVASQEGRGISSGNVNP